MNSSLGHNTTFWIVLISEISFELRMGSSTGWAQHRHRRGQGSSSLPWIPAEEPRERSSERGWLSLAGVHKCSNQMISFFFFLHFRVQPQGITSSSQTRVLTPLPEVDVEKALDEIAKIEGWLDENRT